MHRIPRRAVRAATAVAASALWGIGMAAPAAACDVAPVTFETADLVLTGTVVQREDPAPLAFLFGSPDDLIRWTLSVDGQEKGAPVVARPSSRRGILPAARRSWSGSATASWPRATKPAE